MQGKIDVQFAGFGVVAARREVARRGLLVLFPDTSPIGADCRSCWLVFPRSREEELDVIVKARTDKTGEVVAGERHPPHTWREIADTCDC